MRQSAKEKHILEAENCLLQNHYYESQSALAEINLLELELVQGLCSLPIKYVPKKMPR